MLDEVGTQGSCGTWSGYNKKCRLFILSSQNASKRQTNKGNPTSSNLTLEKIILSSNRYLGRYSVLRTYLGSTKLVVAWR
jgi:hypothetical protein